MEGPWDLKRAYCHCDLKEDTIACVQNIICYKTALHCNAHEQAAIQRQLFAVTCFLYQSKCYRK